MHQKNSSKRPLLIRAVLKDKTTRREAYEAVFISLAFSLFLLVILSYCLALFLLAIALYHWRAAVWVDKNGTWASFAQPSKFHKFGEWFNRTIFGAITGSLVYVLVFNIHAFDDIALKYYVMEGSNAGTKTILYMGANIHADDDFALKAAAADGHTDLVKLLLDSGANIHANNDMALSLAAEEGRIETVKLLLDRGADASGCKGSVALNAAEKNGYRDVADLIRSHRPINDKSLACGIEYMMKNYTPWHR